MDMSKIITKKYADCLNVIEEEKDKALAAPRAAETKQKFDHKISELDLKIAEISNRLATSFNRYPLDIDAVVKLQNEVALLELSKNNLVALKAVLF